ncbi:MAG: hypothetical protein N2171_00620 [Clostridia bacterium]|nr:hypothetical protein [Clostridia bacterium]
MKKILFAVLNLLSLCILCSCTAANTLQQSTPGPIVYLNPESVFTLENAAAIVNYSPVIDGNIEKKNNMTSILYHSEPIGQGDTVRVTVRQYTDAITKQQVKEEYDMMKSMRPKAIKLDNVGEDAYIAYPSVHIYMDGYHIEITAGSGDDDTQKALLEQAAKVACSNAAKILGNR